MYFAYYSLLFCSRNLHCLIKHYTNNESRYTATAATHASRGPKLKCSKVDVGVTLQEWNVLVLLSSGRTCSKAGLASIMPCDGQTCEDDLLKTATEVAAKVLPGLLDVMRSLAVIPIATVVLRRDLQ